MAHYYSLWKVDLFVTVRGICGRKWKGCVWDKCYFYLWNADPPTNESGSFVETKCYTVSGLEPATTRTRSELYCVRKSYLEITNTDRYWVSKTPLRRGFRRTYRWCRRFYRLSGVEDRDRGGSCCSVWLQQCRVEGSALARGQTLCRSLTSTRPTDNTPRQPPSWIVHSQSRRAR